MLWIEFTMGKRPVHTLGCGYIHVYSLSRSVKPVYIYKHIHIYIYTYIYIYLFIASIFVVTQAYPYTNKAIYTYIDIFYMYI